MNPAVQRFYQVIRDLLSLDENTQMRIGRSNQDMEWTDLVVVDALGAATRDSQTQSYDGDAEVMRYGNHYSCPVVVSIYGPDAYDRATDLVHRMRSQAAHDLQRQYEVAVYNFTTIIDVKALTGVQYSGRVDIESVVKYHLSTDVDTDYIDELQYAPSTDAGAINYQYPQPEPGPDPEPTCLYPLDATEQEVLAFGAAGKLTMTNSDQTFAYAYDGSLGSARTYAATVADVMSAPDTIDASSGVTMVGEFTVNEFPSAAPDAASDLKFILADTSFTTVEYRAKSAEGAAGISGVAYSIQVGADTYYLKSGSKIGLYVDASADGLRVSLSGFDSDDNPVNADLGLSVADLSSLSLAALFWFIQVKEDAASGCSGTLQSTMTVDAGETTLTYPAGTKDKCGQVI